MIKLMTYFLFMLVAQLNRKVTSLRNIPCTVRSSLKMSTIETSALPHLILGSGSASRKRILGEAGYSFTVLTADIDESELGDRSSGKMAKELVTKLSNAKADAILQKVPENLKGKILLTADQVVVFKDKILEKPSSIEEARRNIHSYGNSYCTTIGSITLTDTLSLKRVSGIDSSTIHFSPISDEVVEALLNEGEVMYCAGGLMVEHPLIQPFIRQIEGSQDSLMGLSLSIVKDLLTKIES